MTGMALSDWLDSGSAPLRSRTHEELIRSALLDVLAFAERSSTVLNHGESFGYQ